MTPLKGLDDLRSEIANQHENNRDITVNSEQLRVVVPQFDPEKGLEWKLRIAEGETLPMKYSARSQLLSLLNFGEYVFDSITTQGTIHERGAVNLFLNTLLSERKFDVSISTIPREWDDPIIGSITLPHDKGIANPDLLDNIVPLLNLLQRQGHDLHTYEPMGLADDGTMVVHILNKSIQYNIDGVPYYLGAVILNEANGSGLYIASYLYNSHTKQEYGATGAKSANMSRAHMIEVCETLRDKLTDKKFYHTLAMRMAREAKKHVKTKENSKQRKAGRKAGPENGRGNVKGSQGRKKHAIKAKGQRGNNNNPKSNASVPTTA